MWQIWNRNLLNFYGDICEPNEIVNKALFDFHEYENSMFTISSPSHTSDCSDNKNITVAQDGVVMFADVGLQLEKKMASIGVAAMDSYGHLLQAFGTTIQFVGKAITAEALAIREALEKARENGWSKVHILSDAKNVMDMIKKRIVVSWEIETTCEDIWKMMNSFEDINIEYVPRSWNILTHNLAKFSILLLHRINWVSTFPSWIINDAVASFDSLRAIII
ncbi:uncharacterized protein [Nicotiana tomentosiformis]|uniref:uncharacterized protein n=1 Tax=Nicotiana tomentosiformis TaxID=4098 RepID=UPI00388C7D4B